MEGEWTCYRNLQFNGARVVVTQVASLKEGEWSCYRCQFNGEHGHVTGVASLMERKLSFYGGGQFNAGRMDMLQRWSV